MDSIKLEESEIYLKRIEDTRKVIRDQYKFLNDNPKLGPASAFLLMVSVSVLDLCESAYAVFPTLSENLEDELDFVSKASSRIIVLRAYEQRRALFRFRSVIGKIAENDAKNVSFESFDAACREARQDLDYIDNLKDLRDEIAHYNDNHLMIVQLIEKINVPVLIRASTKLIVCYYEFLDIVFKVLDEKIKLQNFVDD